MAQGDSTVRMCGIEPPVHYGLGHIQARATGGIWPSRARDNGSQMFQVNQKETAPGVSFTAGRRSSGALVLIRRGSACRTSAGAGAGLSRILFLRHAFSLSLRHAFSLSVMLSLSPSWPGVSRSRRKG